MVKFSKGMWHNAPDTEIDWAVESWKAEVIENEEGDKLRVLAVSFRVLHNLWLCLVPSFQYLVEPRIRFFVNKTDGCFNSRPRQSTIGAIP